MTKPTGAHRLNKLNDKAVRAAKPGYHSDGGGLYLCVDPNGTARRWSLRITVHGKRREIGLGGYPTVVLAEAREAAHELRKVAKAGGDPLQAHRASRNVEGIPTFKTAARAVHAQWSRAWKNPKHRAQWIRTLETYAFPVIGDRRVNEIHTADILTILGPIWLVKPETARRTRQRIGTVMDWCKAKGHFSGDNPIDGTKKGLPAHPEIEPNHFEAMPYEDVPQFIIDMRAQSAHPLTKLALEFTILTAVRSGNTRLATHAEFDLAAGMWTLSAERMKRPRGHRVPLPDRCLEILSEARAFNGNSPYVFPGTKPSKPLSDGTMGTMIKRMGLQAVPHGFRTSFKVWAVERTNYPDAVSERALAHEIKNRTRRAYERTDLFEKRRGLMADWAHFVTSGSAEIITLPMGRRRA